jgi:hypothetical protein
VSEQIPEEKEEEEEEEEEEAVSASFSEEQVDDNDGVISLQSKIIVIYLYDLTTHCLIN